MFGQGFCSPRASVWNEDGYIHAGYHAGSTAVRDFIDDEQPDLVICGHIHEGRGEDLLGKSKIVNCGPSRDGCYALIDVNQEIRISLCRLPL